MHQSPYVHRSCVASLCEACDGAGRLDHPQSGLDVRCSDCDGYGETYRSEHAPQTEEAGQPAPSLTRSDSEQVSQPISFGGHRVDAPGFTAEQFARAIARALVDELEIHETNGRHIVSHKGLTTGYAVTRTSCTCKAGEVGTPCKHRAILCFHLDLREPALRRHWADARKAVAA